MRYGAKAELMHVLFICCALRVYREKPTVYSLTYVPIPEKELQTTRSSLLHAHRFTIYDLRVPTTTLNLFIKRRLEKGRAQRSLHTFIRTTRIFIYPKYPVLLGNKFSKLNELFCNYKEISYVLVTIHTLFYLVVFINLIYLMCEKKWFSTDMKTNFYQAWKSQPAFSLCYKMIGT
jgi:hypothetical protein